MNGVKIALASDFSLRLFRILGNSVNGLVKLPGGLGHVFRLPLGPGGSALSQGQDIKDIDPRENDVKGKGETEDEEKRHEETADIATVQGWK